MYQDLPTFEVASVKLQNRISVQSLHCHGWGIIYLFRVVDLPAEGLPTNPISGSRGMIITIWVSKSTGNC